MKNKLIWMAVIIVVIFFGLVAFSYPGKMFIANIFSSSDCGPTFNNAFDNALKNNDVSFCSSYNGEVKYGKDVGYGIGCNLSDSKSAIRKNSFKDSCLEAMAYSTKDIEFCKLIEGESSKGSCVLDIARSRGDTSYCDTLEKTNAYYGVCIKNK